MFIASKWKAKAEGAGSFITVGFGRLPNALRAGALPYRREVLGSMSS